MLFPGYRPAVLDDIPITAIVTMEPVGTGTAASSRRCTGMKRTSRPARRRAFTRVPGSPSTSSWRTWSRWS